jgi:HK97 family phage prohead protease
MLTKTQKVSFSIKQWKEEGILKGYASIFDIIDDQNDRVLKGAFRQSLLDAKVQGTMPKMLWQHDPKEPIGVWHRIEEDDKGLYVEGKLLLSLQRASEAFDLIKTGVLDSLSIGYRIVESFKGDKGERLLNKVDLHEISVVTFPANAHAKLTSYKSSGPQDQKLLLQSLNNMIKVLRS